jgi:peptidoglycan hydrolase-like protein with peptidoglycan-binding domain
MKLSHTDMRALVATAFAAQVGRQGTLPELQCLQSIGWLETNYASSWHGPGVDSWNFGAIQRGGWSGSFFEYTDTHPNPDGTSTPYKIGFRKYPDAVSGVADLCKVVYMAFDRLHRVLPAASRGDLLAFSTELHRAPCYYEGFGATDAERIAHHCAAVTSAIRLQCAELGEPMPNEPVLPVIAPALFIGCKGPAVAAWQAIVGVGTDGDFGGATQIATRAWQGKHKLPQSGVVTMTELVIAGLAPDPALPKIPDTIPSPPPDPESNP